jgi:hypothetical protein
VRSRGSFDSTWGTAAVPRISADAALGDAAQIPDHGRVFALAQRCVEVDHGDLAGEREPLGDRPRIAGVERLLLAADELDGLAPHQIDRGHDHRRTSAPSLRSSRLTSLGVCSPS